MCTRFKFSKRNISKFLGLKKNRATIHDASIYYFGIIGRHNTFRKHIISNYTKTALPLVFCTHLCCHQDKIQQEIQVIFLDKYYEFH